MGRGNGSKTFDQLKKKDHLAVFETVPQEQPNIVKNLPVILKYPTEQATGTGGGKGGYKKKKDEKNDQMRGDKKKIRGSKSKKRDLAALDLCK